MDVRFGLRMLAALLCILLASSPAPAADAVYPDREWQRLSSPADSGWSVDILNQAKLYSYTLDTAAVVIVQHGVVVKEWGATALPLRCHSVRKSLLSALFGKHVAEGAIDLDATLAELGIDDNEPGLTDDEQQAQVRDLLKARSGVFHPALYETEKMRAARPERGSYQRDSYWYYNNWDFNALGTIFENSTARSIFEEFEEQLAGPLAMQDFVRRRHTHYVTGGDSVHPAYPFQLSARDLARLGLLFARGGKWKDKQIVPADWVTESTRSYSDAGDSGGYGYMWWVAKDGMHYPHVELPDGSFSARGFRGQFLVVVPDWDLVVVHRVNSFQLGTAIDRDAFGKLLSLILAAAPKGAPRAVALADEGRTSTVSPKYDLVLHGGQVIDGTGREAFPAHVAIRDDRIAAIGQIDPRDARTAIDVSGHIVAPGFIDLHSHAERGLLADDPLRRSAPNLITQGITTVVVNQDGDGPQSIREQHRRMDRLGVGLNVAQLVGHGAVRRAVMKDDYRRAARKAEIQAMRDVVRQGMQEGAFGLSAGLEYVPGRWSTPTEMQALVAELVPFDGVYVVHERSSGSRPMWYLPSRHNPAQPSMIDNLRELIDIGRSTGATVVATHIKARGADFWGSSRLMIELIENARGEGVTIFADQYAYNTSGSDGRIVLIPDWVEQITGTSRSGSDGDADRSSLTPADRLDIALEDQTTATDLRCDIETEIIRRGGAESIVIVDHPMRKFVGQTLAEVAQASSTTPVQAAIDLQLEGDRHRRGGCRLRAYSMSERDVAALAAMPWTATSSDAGIALVDDPPVHPRFYGAFTRKLRHYALDEKVLSLAEAVRVSTSLPAEILKLADRGLLRVGAWADVVVFDPEGIQDRADAFHPHRYSEGISYVLVNGQIAVDDGRAIGTLAGKPLGRELAREPTSETIAD